MTSDNTPSAGQGRVEARQIAERIAGLVSLNKEAFAVEKAVLEALSTAPDPAPVEAGVPVAWTGQGSLDAIAEGRNGTLYPEPPSDEGIALYRAPYPAPLTPSGASVEGVARAIVGPYRPVPASSKWALDELREIRWKQLTSQEQAEALEQARAVLALTPAPTQGGGTLTHQAWFDRAADRALVLGRRPTRAELFMRQSEWESATPSPAPVSAPATDGEVRPWPKLKKALWDVVTSAQLNAKYVNAWDLTERLYHAALSHPATGEKPAKQEDGDV